MADIPMSSSVQISVTGDFSTNPYLENVVEKEPTNNVFVNPLSNNPNNVDPSTVKCQPQSQWGAMGNLGSTPNMYDVQTMVNPEINNIENYMVWSVLNIFCCCLCLGLIACYYSSETKNLKVRGDIQGALNASRNARTINIIGTVLGTISLVLYFFLCIVALK